MFPPTLVGTKLTIITLQVAGLSPETSEDKVKDFFLFCGAISSLKKDGNTADITFQKESAARTALMLNGGTVSGQAVAVTADDVKLELIIMMHYPSFSGFR
jgi:hypothetical protein